jgi:hypothetical protein
MDARALRIKAMALYDAMAYPPTVPELDAASAPAAIEAPFKLIRGRVVFEGREALIEEHERREALFPAKVKRARQVAKFLGGLSGVRFVALCNTTALAHASEDGDLDFFVITHKNTIMQTRGWSTLRFAFSRPGTRASDRDAVCLSYFVDDSALDLSPHQLKPDNGQLKTAHDDPYFRFWFLSLLPLYDDGVSAELWKANTAILSQHPNARPWIVSEDLRVTRPWWRLPTIPALDALAARLHEFLISPKLKSMRNLDTRVIINEHVLKFHADDGRERFRSKAQETAHKYGVAS